CGKPIKECAIVDDGERRREGAEQVLQPKGIDSVFDAHAGIVLRQHSARTAEVAHAAMENRGGETDGIEHGAAADGECKGLPVYMARGQLAQYLLDAIVLVLP